MAIPEEEIERFLSTLPQDPGEKKKRAYEQEITDWVMTRAGAEDFARLETYLKTSLDRSATEGRAFDAFFALANLYRRYAKVSDLERLIGSQRNRFEASPYGLLFSHLEIMSLKLRGDRQSCLEALEKATAIWEEGRTKHAGLSHNYAETVAMCIEKGFHGRDEDLLRKALRAADEAIRLDVSVPKYAKFYRTRGWLSFLLRNAEQGQRCYQTAIELEDPARLDYGIRLAEYRRELDFNNARLQLQELQQNAGDVLERISTLQEEVQARQLETQTRQLEFLGFFTGILALILGGGGLLMTARDDIARFGLMVSLGGVLLFVFGGFGLVLRGTDRPRQSLAALGLGILLLACGFLILLNRPG